MRINKNDALALVIDVQDRLFPHMFNREEFLRNILILTEGLQILDIPMIVTQQYTKGLGNTIEPLKNKLGQFEPIEKIAFSCYDESKIVKKLNFKNKNFIIVAGIESHVCILQTVIDLINVGYTPVLVHDCVSSRKENDKEIAIERIRHEGAIVTSYESILLELCRVAGSETFKAISKLIK